MKNRVPKGVKPSRDKLARLLSGSTAEARARTSLRQTLYAVRKSVGGVDPPPLRMEADTVALDSHTVSVDVAGFLQGTAATTASALADALALYQGDFLEGLAIPEPPFEGWLLGERERLREQALEGLGRLLAYQQAAGATEAAVQTALRLLALEPLQESAHRALMRLYAETGGVGRRSASINSAWQRSSGSSGRSPRPRRRPSTRTSCAAAPAVSQPRKARQSEASRPSPSVSPGMSLRSPPASRSLR